MFAKADFTKHNDLVKGVVAEDDGSPISPYQALGLMEGGYRPPPYWNRTGECCKPTEKCHAYVGWMMDMQSQNAWENPEQKAEANSHIECCMRQYKASCKDPMDGNKIVWRDPRKACSPTKDQALKKELENKEKEEQQENDADEQDQRNDENDQEHEEVDEGMHP